MVDLVLIYESHEVNHIKSFAQFFPIFIIGHF